ncbi:uncharacterized protein OCT59_005874 [Rhizophagus irregularis]|uniref:Uncharacterized protein n=1 Tax=Rhizophagus irregularis (strain DAOM 197198w) TaxID=1432141 RepID=A0A015M3G5_RHIIW|nr:hypothetical protein RirG_171510 [Rhizophagus irregularis DAOM 197198w]UZO14417.1 hypothetical protein OCT59_005874 [Rhizophagus irregularis]GBC38102.2 hypothetical protein GLOIN_2v1846162 [Rhizophagus irregularis DAOM 181602=DAOM 197198]CAG8672941.1 5282_t:CDS:2 [Rhizophagus irregularis]
MKFLIFFVALLIVNVVNVNAKLTCEEHFGVSLCNECQNEVWDFGRDPSGCGFYDSLFSEIEHSSFFLKYNLTAYNEVITNLCSLDFSCSYEEGKKIWQKVEEKCANELTIYIDWSANPSSLDHTVVSSYATILFYYFSVPEHNSICHKSSGGELCGIEAIKPLVDWLKQEIPEGNVQFSYDQQYVYKKDGTRIQIPMELVGYCGECGKNMIKEYKSWMDKFAVPDVILNKVFGNNLEALKGYFSCPLIL